MSAIGQVLLVMNFWSGVWVLDDVPTDVIGSLLRPDLLY